MGFHEKTSTVFGVALIAVAFGGIFLPELHPMFDFLGGGRSAEGGGSLTGKFVGETLIDATLRNCEVRDGKLIRVQTYNCLIVNTEIVESKVHGGKTSGSWGSLTEFRNGELHEGTFDNVTLLNMKATGTTASGVIIRAGSLTGATVQYGNVDDVAIQGGTFKGVTARSTLAETVAVAEGASFTLSRIENYTLKGGAVSQSTLLNVRNEGADVEASTVKQADLVARRVAREGQSLVATVSNTGSAAAPYYEVVFKVNGREAGRTLVKATAAGTSMAVAAAAPSWASSGTLEAQVDATDRIPETNEGNNVARA